MTGLQLWLFGPPRVELAGAAVEFNRRKVLALLIYLAVSGQPHSRDALATLFWPDYSQRQARTYLRRDLAVLNTALAGEWLVADRDIVELKQSAELWIDVIEFGRSFDLSLRSWALAVVQCGLQDYQTARRSVQQTLSFAHQAAYPALMTWPIPVAAILLTLQGQTERAVELLGLAFHHPLSLTGWINRWPLVSELRHELEVGLEPEIFQRAWRRGQDGDLKTVVAALLAEFGRDDQVD